VPLAAWGSLQMAVLHLLPGVPPALRTEVLLGVALAGLLLTFADGRLVPRAALVTTAPWHVAGVGEGCRTAWTASDTTRAVAVLVVAAAVLVAVARTGVRAPLMVGAGTALALGLGFTVRALPWPLAAALVVGAVLLVLGTRRERRPVAGFGRRLADLR
jgi:hypothetical protein